jgi:hypothetical protein
MTENNYYWNSTRQDVLRYVYRQKHIDSHHKAALMLKEFNIITNADLLRVLVVKYNIERHVKRGGDRRSDNDK